MFLITAFNTLSKLTEPRSDFNQRAESLAKSEKYRFSDRPSRLYFISNSNNASGVKRAEFSMLDRGSDAIFPQHVPKFVPVVLNLASIPPDGEGLQPRFC
jgi:hypothetical protein